MAEVQIMQPDIKYAVHVDAVISIVIDLKVAHIDIDQM